MPRTDIIKDRDTIKELVGDWRIDNAPAWSIDTLLTWPEQATAMARWICRRLHRKPTPANVHEILRAAMACRKRGDLRRDRC